MDAESVASRVTPRTSVPNKGWCQLMDYLWVAKGSPINSEGFWFWYCRRDSAAVSWNGESCGGSRFDGVGKIHFHLQKMVRQTVFRNVPIGVGSIAVRLSLRERRGLNSQSAWACGEGQPRSRGSGSSSEGNIRGAARGRPWLQQVCKDSRLRHSWASSTTWGVQIWRVTR